MGNKRVNYRYVGFSMVQKYQLVLNLKMPELYEKSNLENWRDAEFIATGRAA